jgi:hypothetical protein
MKNPLYPSTIITKETINNYNRCLVITLESNPIDEIFDENVNDTFYTKIKDNYKITSIPMWIIKHLEYHKFIVFEIVEDDILKFKFAGVDLNNEEIMYNLSNACILIPNHPWVWFYKFIEVYVLDGFKNMYSYLMNDLYAPLDIPFDKLLDEIKKSMDVKYWSNINKCQINITTPWLLRDINFNDAKEINIDTQQNMNIACNDYLQSIYNNNKYVDASSGIKTHKYKLYYIDEYSNLPIDKMILKLTDNNIMHSTILSGLVSKKYCHHLIKNNDILKYIHNNFNKYNLNFGYAWLMMYLEEGILKSYITVKDRCVFTLNQAKNLPNKQMYNNVYVPLLVEKTYINFIGGYNNNDTMEFADIDTFKQRVQLFINNNNIDVFKGMDWKNIAITGSVIPATCRKADPLEIGGGFTTEEFFNTYYKESDIDIMCDLPNYILYIDKVQYMISVFKKNILEKFPLCENPINIDITKNASLQLNKKYIDEFYNSKITEEEAYKLYCDMKKKETKQTDSKYDIIDTVVEFDQFKYYVYNNDELKEPVLAENIKFHISSPHLSRKFEVFKIKYNFLSTVSRFHLPCVRGYYDGTEVYLLPSAISALITNKCIDYKYFAGVRSPFDILLKYVFRGFTIFLNKKELIKLAAYIKNSDKWKTKFNTDFGLGINTYQTYYKNPFVFLNKPNINYINHLKTVEPNMISPIVSALGYVIPY